MAERQIDIAAHRSKAMGEMSALDFDYVVTVCDNASESCPIFPGAPERIHWSIADLAAVEGDDEARVRAFRNAADELTTRIRYLLAQIGRKPFWSMTTLALVQRAGAECVGTFALVTRGAFEEAASQSIPRWFLVEGRFTLRLGTGVPGGGVSPADEARLFRGPK